MARTKQTARKSEAPKEEEEGNGQPTYADYLAERGYTPLCCDNWAEDLFTIFCCFASQASSERTQFGMPVGFDFTHKIPTSGS